MLYRFADSLGAGSGWNEFYPDPAPSSGVFYCTHRNGMCYTGMLSAGYFYQKVRVPK